MPTSRLNPLSRKNRPTPKRAGSKDDLLAKKDKRRTPAQVNSMVSYASETEFIKLLKKTAKRGKKKKRNGYKSETSATTSDSDGATGGRSGSPVYFLLRELRKVSPYGKVPRSFPALEMTGVFDEWTDERKNAYGKDLIMAVRARNIDQLRIWHNQGRTMQAANGFGESVLHLACRRGFLDVVKFLVEEANVNLWIRDDTGRTPLHDACWTATPCYELVDFIVAMDRDMLFVSDKRGHTPLDYTRKEYWESWIAHFQEKDMKDLVPKRKFFFTDRKSLPTPETANKAILEDVDDMIRQLDLNRANARRRNTSSRRREPIAENAQEETLDTQSNRSKGSSHRRRRSRRGTDDDQSNRSNRSNRSQRSNQRPQRTLKSNEEFSGDGDNEEEVRV